MNKAKVVQKAEAGEGLTVAEIKVYQKAVKSEKQVYGKYGKDLAKGIARGDFSCFDMAMAIMPAAVLTAVSVVINSCVAAVTLAGSSRSVARYSALRPSRPTRTP